MPFLQPPAISEITELRILLSGDPGTGKSTFAASLPQPGYLFDLDRTSLNYSRPGMQWWVEPKIGDPALSLAQRWAALKQDLVRLVKEPGEYRSVVLDSTTSLARMALDYSMELNRARGPDGGPIWNVHRAMAKNLVDEIINLLCSIPRIVCVIAHNEVVKNELTGEIAGQLNLPGRLSIELPARFDEVWVSTATRTKDGVHYEVHFVPTGWHRARSRLRGFLGSKAASAPNEWEQVVKALTTK